MRPRFTRHATDRVLGRLTLTFEEVSHILEKEQYVLIGRDRDSSRVHKLFYSELDSFWFVAIQDEADGMVVTILPIDYHNRWRIADETLQQARMLREGPPKPPQKPVPKETVGVVKFGAIIETKKGNRRHVKLGSFPKKPGSSGEDLLADHHVVARVRQTLSEQIREGETLISCTLRIGNRGLPTNIVLPALTEM